MNLNDRLPVPLGLIQDGDCCYDETGLCFQNLDPTLGLIENTIEKSYVNIEEKESHHFDLL